MSNEIFKEIYEISLLNLYIYTDCALLFVACPTKWSSYSIVGSGIDPTIHLLKHDELLSIQRITPSQEKLGYPLWKEQLKTNVNKINHIYLNTFYGSLYCVLVTIKNNNLFITFRGTCNLDECLLDIEILLKSHMSKKEPILSKFKKL